MSRFGSPLKDRRTAGALVGFLAALVYVNSISNGFAFDDILIVVQNRAIQSFETLPGALVSPYWPGEYGQELGLWRPVATGVYGLLHALGGGAPLVFHLVNVFAHAATSLLVLALLLELMSVPAALIGGVVFAVHPVHVEAVANVVGFSEIISTAAVVAACLIHVRSGPGSRWMGALGIGLLYALGFGAKESAVTLPALIFLLDAAREPIGFRQLPGYLTERWRTYLIVLLVAGGMLTARYAILGGLASPLAPLGGALLEEVPRIWTLGEVWVHYVRLWVFPMDLSMDYSPGVIPISVGWGLESALGVSLAILVLSTAMIAWRRPDLRAGTDSAKVAALGVVWFVIAISPVSNTVFLSGVLLAERTLYLPSVGLAAATGWLVVRVHRDRPRLAVLGVLLATSLGGVRTWTRNGDWADNATAFTVLIRDHPQSGRSQWVIGDISLDRGEVSDGLRSYRAAIDLLGTDYQLVTEISKRLIAEERYRAARRLLEIIADERPELPLAHSLLAWIHADRGDAAGAELRARTSLSLYPRDVTRAHLLAWALMVQGHHAEAAVARADAEALGESFVWQQYMYMAFERRHAGDMAAARLAVDSAWAHAGTDVSRIHLDSVSMSEFGLGSRIDGRERPR